MAITQTLISPSQVCSWGGQAESESKFALLVSQSGEWLARIWSSDWKGRYQWKPVASHVSNQGGICITMEYYSAIKKNKIMPFAAICMNLDIIILSEVSQTKMNIMWYHLHVESNKNDTNELIYTTETDSQFFFFLVFLPFLGPLPQHMEIPRLGVESEL